MTKIHKYCEPLEKDQANVICQCPWFNRQNEIIDSFDDVESIWWLKFAIYVCHNTS